MSREARLFFSRLIVAGVFILSIVAATLAHFLVTLIAVAGGLLVWLLYLLSAGLGAKADAAPVGGSLGRNVSKVLAGLGLVLAISAFLTYGIEQTMWGSFVFNLQGVAVAMLVLLLSIAPLVMLQLTSKPGSHAATSPESSSAYPAAKRLPAQPYYQPPPPEEFYAEEDDELDEDDDGEYWDEDEDWGEDDEEEEEDDEYEEEEDR